MANHELNEEARLAKQADYYEGCLSEKERELAEEGQRGEALQAEVDQANHRLSRAKRCRKRAERERDRLSDELKLERSYSQSLKDEFTETKGRFVD